MRIPIMFVFATLFSHLLNVTEYMPFERYSKQDHFTVTLHIIWQVNRKLSFHREQNFNVCGRDLVDIVNEHLMAVSWWRAPKEKWVLISLRLKNRTKKKELQRNHLLEAGRLTNLLGFQGARPDHVRRWIKFCVLLHQRARWRHLARFARCVLQEKTSPKST